MLTVKILDELDRGPCTAPGFLDTERGAVATIGALASCDKAALWEDTETAPPVIEAPR
jgi:hypothetical protein